MAKTFGTLKNSVADWLGIRDTDTNRLPDSVRGDVVNATIKDLCRQYNFRFAEATWATQFDPTNIVPSARYTWALPTDWSRASAIRITTETFENEIEYLDPTEFDTRFPNPATADAGTPEYYTIWGGNLVFAPTPDAAYYVNVSYFKQMADLVGTNDTNDFLTYAWDVVLWKCLGSAALYGVEDARIAVFEQKANASLNALIVEHSMSRTMGRQLQAAEAQVQ